MSATVANKLGSEQARVAPAWASRALRRRANLLKKAVRALFVVMFDLFAPRGIYGFLRTGLGPNLPTSPRFDLFGPTPTLLYFLQCSFATNA
jgi:hypothetical protein